MDEVRRALVLAPTPAASPVERLARRWSAVLAPLYELDGEVYVVLTRRSWNLRTHTGEVSFPGGGADPEDLSLWHTACREAHEEIGLEPEAVERIGELDHLSTITSGSVIIPYVGALQGQPALTPNPNEVDAILYVALSELLTEGVHHEERWGVPRVDHGIHFFLVPGDTIWGATGAMLFNLLRWLVPELERRG
jgi:8-oxo-dGTP pyrophosphatase MutT (NUDIX family)